MSLFRNIIFVLFISLTLSRYVRSLECYSCKNCDNPLDLSNTERISLNGSGLFCTKVRGAYLVDRNITDSCKEFTAVGNGVWCCQTDLCNGINQILPMNLFGIILIVCIIFKMI